MSTWHAWPDRPAWHHQDLRPRVPPWFAESGFHELSFDAEPEGYGVGVTEGTPVAQVTAMPGKLFVFTR